MNKTEIICEVADYLEVSRRTAEKTVDIIFAKITEALAEGDKVNIAGFGQFEVRARAERKGVNPRTGEEIVVPASKTPVFKPGKQLKDSVNKK